MRNQGMFGSPRMALQPWWEGDGEYALAPLWTGEQGVVMIQREQFGLSGPRMGQPREPSGDFVFASPLENSGAYPLIFGPSSWGFGIFGYPVPVSEAGSYPMEGGLPGPGVGVANRLF